MGRLRKRHGSPHPHNLRARSHEQDAPQPHDQLETHRGRNRRKPGRSSLAPEWMRQSGMAK